MSAPDSSSSKVTRRLLLWIALATSVAGVGAVAFACWQHMAAVAWLEAPATGFKGSNWEGWPCRLEARLAGPGHRPTWSMWIRGAHPAEVSWTTHTALSAEDGRRLRQLGGFRMLTLPTVGLTPAFFENLGHPDALTGLSANGAAFDDACAAELASLPALRILIIVDTPVTGVSFPSLPELEVLQASGSRITDAGCARLAACRKLKRVNLQDTAVTLEGARALLALPHLERLGLPAEVDAAGVQALVKSMRRKVEVFGPRASGAGSGGP